MKKQSIWVFEWRKSVHYWWSSILFSPECKELTSMLDPLLYRWAVPPVVIRCVHWTMQMWVLQTWIIAQGSAIVMSSPVIAETHRWLPVSAVLLQKMKICLFFTKERVSHTTGIAMKEITWISYVKGTGQPRWGGWLLSSRLCLYKGQW